MFIRAYLRASTDGQDASRARESLLAFAKSQGADVATCYTENASGAQADRPELLRLIADSYPGDVLLVESIDRLTRLPADDWQKLKVAIDDRGLRIVAVDLPTSYQCMKPSNGDAFTDRMLAAINGMMIDMGAAIARKDYEQRRERQAQGIVKAKADGKYKGRKVDHALHRRVLKWLEAGNGIRETARNCECSTTTVMRIRDKDLEAKEAQQ